MKLIADSGSTKTSWILLANQNILQEFETTGMNPFFISEDEILYQLENKLRPDVKPHIKEVHFFGAGCSTVEKAEWLENVFSSFFESAEVSIKTDIEGAVIAASNLEEKSIVSILGTGSSFRIFDGKNIIKKYSSLGFIIGDEGSGTHISKALLRKIMYQQFSGVLQSDFFSFFNTSRESIIESVYSKPLPNRYLAQFTKFCSRHITHPDIEQIVLDSFEDYFQNHLLSIKNIEDYKLHFIGSIAFHFQEQLQKIAEKHQLKIGNIVQKPIYELAKSLK